QDYLLEANEKQIKGIYTNDYASLVIFDDNSIIAWGNSSYGANISGIDLTQGVEKVVFNRLSFAVLLSNGTVVSWGDSSSGGNSSSLDLTNVIDIASTDYGYTALKNDGTL